MPAPCFLEQAMVMKGDSLNVVSGTSKNGFPYGIRVMDFVLRKVLDNEKYSQVIVVSLGDRNDSCFTPYKLLYPFKFQLLSPAASGMNVDDGTDEAVRAVLGCSSVNRMKSVLNALEERLNAMNATPVSEHKLNDENSEKGNKVAVMIYSFSELAIHLGEQNALCWLQAYSRATSAATNFKISSNILLHKSLHSSSFLVQIEALCCSVCHVHSTYGQFHDDEREICCTTHTVRKAPSTGRVGEGTDLFTMKNFYVNESQQYFALDAIASMKNIEHDTASVIKQEEEEEKLKTDDDTSAVTVPATLSTLLNNDTEEDNKISSKSSVNNIKKKEMLVVFDRSDPEFESDSDPDDDLDL